MMADEYNDQPVANGGTEENQSELLSFTLDAIPDQEHDSSNDLEQSYLQFARNTLSCMRQWCSTEGVSTFGYLAHSFDENGYQRWSALTIDYAMLLQKHVQDLLALKETQQCVQRHLQAGIIVPSLQKNKKAGTTEQVPQDGSLSPQQHVVLDLVVPLIESCRQAYGQGGDFEASLEASLRVNDEQLLADYHRLLILWSDELERTDITFPLVNFTCDATGEQAFGPHLFLRPLTPIDKTALWNDDAQHFPFSEPPLDAHTLMSLSWKLSGTYTFLKDDNLTLTTAKQEALLELGDIVTALRLLKKGDVGAPAIYEKYHTPVLWQGVRLANVLKGPQQARQFPFSPFLSYVLTEQDIAEMKELSNALYRLRSGKTSALLYGEMSVALRHFNQSYHRDLPEEQIIDLTIALESSLLADLRDELNYRLSLRGTALLAPTRKWEPSQSQGLLKAMYDIRSGIVHNGRLLTDLEKDLKKLHLRIGIDPHNFVQWCQDIVRNVLKEYVLREARGQTLKEINAELDTYIVESLRVSYHPRFESDEATQ
ncbi:hypothetical protein KSF_108300 [Reticulibacter mediterranei]|uniref:Apea-like HEPN domain-containing protein n=1 Tax=Reticulibacter mediterranei TaxID=2778369 RepID=A0A8J3J1T0_9CHLR|nr:HEPN domain-containing protein [Reticulibacter mediterranei]GHP00783.1 hypothetical protein KSF_108300 [Reticulibacter mediterranei]